jgi:microcompartment protein CcmK/EutM
MRIAEIIGTVTLSRAHPSLVGARWLIGVPFSLEALRRGEPDGEDLVIFDQLGAGAGSRIGFAEGGEAAAPFLPAKKAVDAYCACLLDQIVINE